MDVRRYRKFLVALGVGVGVLVSLGADGQVDVADVSAIVAAFLGALGVYRVPNAG